MHLYIKTAKRFFAIAMCFSVLLFSGCTSFGMLNKIYVNQWIKCNESQTENKLCYMSKRADNKVLAGNKSELYIGKNGGISLYDKASGVSWNSLPAFSNTFAADFFITVFDGEDLYTLDTSSCRAEKDGFSYSKTENTVTCLYKLQKNEIVVQLPVEFSFNGAYLSVSVDISSCVVSDGIVLVSVSFLPFFGGIRYDENTTDLKVFGDYFLVPDGPGALIRTAVENEDTSYVYSVFGKEYFEKAYPSYIGAYGIKSGENAISATVTEACEYSYIKVIRSNADRFKINRVYPEFVITEISGTEGEINISKDGFSGKCTVMYEALSGDSADYMGMAVSVRQAVIECGFLSSESVSDEYPFYVSVIGSADGKKQSAVTNFQQAENLLSILKGKGVNEINMILEGFFKGGISEKSGVLKNPSIVGNEKDLRELVSYAAKQQLNVFVGVNVLTTGQKSETVKSVFGENKPVTVKNELAPYFGAEKIERYHRSFSGLSTQFSAVLKYIDNNNINGVAVLDSDVSCVSDYSSVNGNYEAYSKELADNISSCAVRANIMLDGANMNVLKYADYVKNMTFETGVPESSGYSAVPFIPAVLHSSCVYAGQPVNAQSVTKLNLLKSVEYGAMPYYTWVFNSESDKCYELSINEAVDFYLNAKAELVDLTSKRITDHFEYESGVYCTVFDSDTNVYVNYNNYSVLIGEVAVLPYDYLRIG